MSSSALVLVLIGFFDIFNITVAFNTLPSKICIPIEVQQDVTKSIQLLNKQNCDLQYVVNNPSDSEVQDRIEQLQLSYLIYHNQKVFDKSPFSTIRKFELKDAVKQGDLDGEYRNIDATINIQESTPFLVTVHEVNHSLIRQVTATSYLNFRFSLKPEQRYFASMLGPDYLKVVNRKMSYEDSTYAFGSPYPVTYEFFKTTMLAGSEANSTLVEQYFENPAKLSKGVTANIQRMEQFTDRAIIPGYHSNPVLKSILSNNALKQTDFNICLAEANECKAVASALQKSKMLELDRLITQMNSLSSSQAKTSYIHFVGLVTYMMIALTKLFVAFVLIVTRIKYGKRTKPKNQKNFTLY
jgi:hypothetical protein